MFTAALQYIKILKYLKIDSKSHRIARLLHTHRRAHTHRRTEVQINKVREAGKDDLFVSQ